MPSLLWGVDGVKNQSGKCEGPRQGGGDQQLFEKIIFFLKNQKHEPNIVEITHLCIMHGAHTSIVYIKLALTSIFLVTYLTLSQKIWVKKAG